MGEGDIPSLLMLGGVNVKWYAKTNIKEEFPFGKGSYDIEQDEVKDLPDWVANTWVARGYPIEPAGGRVPAPMVETPKEVKAPNNKKRGVMNA